jgi:hypothetical protein
MFGEEYKLWSSSLCTFLHSPVISSLFGPNFSLAPCSQTHSFCVPPLMLETKFRTHTEPQPKFLPARSVLMHSSLGFALVVPVYPAETSARRRTSPFDHDFSAWDLCTAVGILCLHSRDITSSCNFSFFPLTSTIHAKGIMHFETRTNAC